jgi:lipopolysaccharide transport system ATP-binding protein
MSEIAIRCEGLSKQYRIGQQERYKALRDVIADAAASPLRRLRHALRNGSEVSRLPNGNGSATGSDLIWALDDVSFEVKRSEVVGIIGRNGAGKSTLLKIFSRITKPTRGHAEINGRVGALLEVGTGFHPELTGRENIYLNAAILGMRKAEVQRKFDEIVAFAEVDKYIDTPVKRYSSGMYVRLAFAVAAHLEPEILIVDEVLAVGDASFQKKCLSQMGRAARGGRSILFVSHNLAAINALCTRCLLLDQGLLVLDGTPAEVTAQYQRRVYDNALNFESLKEVEHCGTARAQFTALEIQGYTRDGSPLSYVQTGSDFEITVEITGRDDIQDVNVAAVIYDVNGVRLLDVNTALKSSFLSLSGGQKAQVSFRLEDVLLKPGTYLLGLWLGRGGIEEIDSVQHAASFSVEPSPSELKHTETFPGPYQCRFDHSIKLHPSTDSSESFPSTWQ